MNGDKKFRRVLHDLISKTGYEYWEIYEIGKDLLDEWGK